METITKNEDGTFIIDGKVYRAVKDLVTSPDANTKEADPWDVRVSAFVTRAGLWIVL